MQVTVQQGDNLDLVIYRHLGNSSGLLEETLKLNPKLNATAILDIGTVVTLPEKTSHPVAKNTVQLWS